MSNIQHFVTVSKVPGIGDGRATRQLMYVIVVSRCDFNLDTPYEDRMIVRNEMLWEISTDSTYPQMWEYVTQLMKKYDVPIQNLIREGA